MTASGKRAINQKEICVTSWEAPFGKLKSTDWLTENYTSILQEIHILEANDGRIVKWL